MKRLLLPLFLLLFSFLVLSCFAQPKYEFRAVWIASVENIDWPSKKGLSVTEQKAEFIRILNMHQRNGLNAVIVQIRPVADALYQSTYEPWSEYLTGTQGMPPVPYYDPLQFMIEETHKRGMEFHAWLNPYRAVFNIYTSSVSPAHITRQHPDWFITYNKQKIFDPGNPAVIDYVSNIVKDIVTRYDVDGIHMDDYFYPYPAGGRDFPDERSYALYGKGINKKDWRRSNCDSIIKRIHETIIAAKPMIKFGISPFGVWRNQSKDSSGSNTHAGISNYDDLYADILLWLQKGWIDYAVPQLYWEIGHKLCDYQTLIDWWGEHSYGRQIFIGHALYRAGLSTAWRNKNELPQEVELTRETPNIYGSVYFSSKDFYRNQNGFNDSLREHYYKTPALIPPMSWIDTTAPATPVIIASKDDKTVMGNIIKIDGEVRDTSSPEVIKSFVLYLSNDSATLGNTPFFISAVDSANQHQFSFNIYGQQIPAGWAKCYVAVSGVDRENNESLLSNKVVYTKTELGWKRKKEENNNQLSRNDVLR
ncbi:MAG: family 10 glycosylhydrolase [Bacteroidota bacterium]|nr:family 10 glycosylhydrolase [Bacteroidota bacterium]